MEVFLGGKRINAAEGHLSLIKKGNSSKDKEILESGQI